MRHSGRGALEDKEYDDLRRLVERKNPRPKNIIGCSHASVKGRLFRLELASPFPTKWGRGMQLTIPLETKIQNNSRILCRLTSIEIRQTANWIFQCCMIYWPQLTESRSSAEWASGAIGGRADPAQAVDRRERRSTAAAAGPSAAAPIVTACPHTCASCRRL